MAALSVQKARGAKPASGSAALRRSSRRRLRRADPLETVLVGRLAARPTMHERWRAWYEAARSALLGLRLLVPQVADRVRERGLEAREREVEPEPGRPGPNASGSPSLASRSISAPPGTRARAAVRPCRTPRPPRRPSSSRYAPNGHAHGPQEQCPSPQHAQERRLAARARGTARATCPRDGRRERAAGASPTRAPSPRRSPRAGAPTRPRPLGHRDSLDVARAACRGVERLTDDRHDELEVAAGRDLGHDAAVPRVELGLRRDDRARTRPSSLRRRPRSRRTTSRARGRDVPRRGPMVPPASSARPPPRSPSSAPADHDATLLRRGLAT